MFTKPNSRDTAAAGLKGAMSSAASGPKLQNDESLGYVVVDSKATFRGELVTEGDIVIDGVFEGVIQGRKLIVTANGRVAGKVRVDTAKVSGIVEPEIHCREVLEITSTGTVRGSPPSTCPKRAPRCTARRPGHGAASFRRSKSRLCSHEHDRQRQPHPAQPIARLLVAPAHACALAAQCPAAHRAHRSP